MPELTKVAVANASNSVRTTIPASIAEELQITKGDVLVWSLDGKTIIISKWEK